MQYTGPTGTRPNDAKTGPKGEAMTPIPSASLVVLCPLSATESGSSRYATLMLQRSARDGSSFRSAVVFPGGALDVADEDAVQRMAQGNLSPCTNEGSEAQQQQRSDASEAAYAHSLRLCALRETFEETGLLLVPAKDSKGQKSRAITPAEAGIDSEEWKALREEIHNDARAFPPFLTRVYRAVCSEDGLDGETILPPLAPMTHHSNWVTPRMVVRPAKRFDAHFFLTVLDKADALGPLSSASASHQGTAEAPENLLSLSADGTETTSLKLATAEEMIELAIRDQIVLFPPQFYILADLVARLRTLQSSDTILPPLTFRHQAESTTSTIKEATPVEEEPRGLHPDSYYQFEKRPKQEQNSKSVTSVEPRAMPERGSSVNHATLYHRGNGEPKSTPIEANVPENGEDQPFVFPLVLPGDFLASQDQQNQMSGTRSANSRQSQDRPLNRVYVTPRSKQDGGGLVVRGARRRGLPGLVDFEEGARLEEMGSETEQEEEGGGGETPSKDNRAKL